MVFAAVFQALKEKVRVVPLVAAFGVLLAVAGLAVPPNSTFLHWTAWPAWVGICSIWAVAAVIDLREKRLPNSLTLAGFVLFLSALIPVAQFSETWGNLIRAVMAGLISVVVYFVLGYLAPGQLGLGDVKLAASTGVALGWFSWPAVLVGHTIGFVTFSIFGLIRATARKSGLKDELPFGPFMMVGALLGPAISGMLF